MNTSQTSIIDQIADERDKLRSALALISTSRDHALARINRLEKAGDDMYNLLNNCPEAYAWNKIKEYKP